MSKKIKRALRKAAKAAVPMLAVAGLGTAFMNARNRKAMLEGADARKLMTSNVAMRNSMMQNPMVTAEDLIKLNEGTEFGLGPLDGAKDGGRITKSGVKRRTKKFAKKKKQANKMRKK